MSHGRNRVKRHARQRRTAWEREPADAPLPRRVQPPEPPPPSTALDVYPRLVSPEDLGTDRDDTTLTAELAARLRAIPACNHCGGRHTRACPRVKAMSWHPNGSLAAVTFWPDGKWSDEQVLWDEQIPADD